MPLRRAAAASGAGAGRATGRLDGDTDEFPLAEIAERDRGERERRTQPRRVPWPFVLAGAALVIVPAVASAAVTGPVGLLEAVSVQLGVFACGLLVAVVLIVSRFRRVSRTMGLPLLMQIHRHLGVLTVVVILVHVAAAVAHNPRGLRLLDPFDTTSAARGAIAATVAVVLLAFAFAMGRRRPRHTTRRMLHIGLALVVIGGVVWHVGFLARMVRSPVGLAWMLALVAVLVVALLARWVFPPLRSRGSYVVHGIRDEGGEVFTLSLVPRGSAARLAFRPGQFVWLRRRRLPLGGEEHPFTIASSAEVLNRLELTITRSGPFTQGLQDLHRGDRVWLDGPHGAFTGADTVGTGLVLIAGGAGITPMLSMLRTLADREDDHAHALIFSQRDGQDLFDNELDVLSERLDLDIRVLSSGEWIDPAMLREVIAPGREHELGYYVCGPGPLVDSAEAALTRLGVPAELINTETY